MATRTLLSPGVEIRERDLSLTAPQNVGTNIFIAGYASQGPTDEVLKITTRDELIQIYGTPTNSAERYFYHGITEQLNSPASIYTSRLPYGENAGSGFGSNYSALVYPALAYTTSIPSMSAGQGTDYTAASATYVLGDPVQMILTEDEYFQAQEGSLFTWSTSAIDRSGYTSLDTLGNAGLIILNKAQTTINSQFEGYYVGIADNTNINPDTVHNAIIGAKTVSLSSDITTSYTDIPNGTLQFSLSSASGYSASISQVMENLTDYNIDGRDDDDVLNIGVFKLRKSLYATAAYKLDYVLEDRIVGSVDSYRTQLNPLGGPTVSFFLESADENSRNVEILVNPYISNKFSSSSLNAVGIPTKKMRVLTNRLIASNDVVKSGVPTARLTEIAARIGYADNLYALGTYSDSAIASKQLGSIPSKIERALDAVVNDEIYDIDVVVEAGLGTIYVATEELGTTYYDDTAIVASISALQTSSDLGATGENIRANYSTVFNKFENFCNLPSNTGGRGDCIFIADPIRQLMVKGKNTKTLSDRTKNFQQHIYWGIRHQFELENTSYAAVYGNWAQVYDEFLGDKIWVPFSSVAAAAYARNDAAEFPWSAPAGYTRGLVSGNVVNIAITPNQKQRDELYKSNINPVLFSPSQGMAIFGQKTLSRKPSSFDRINVRRLFLALERPTKKASVFYVFEPNNEFTRTRFVNTLTPIFEYAKNNGGLYDYLIVCDERNNTPEVIDSNELKADIYIKATRTAEFIIVTFTSTRTDANFQELIG